jgi:acetyl esterase/lipase
VNRTRWLLLACGVPLVIVIGVLLSAGLAGRQPYQPPPATGPQTSSYRPDGADRVDVGSGAQSAAIFRPSAGAAADAPVVVFLHGWAAIDAAFYGPWIDHLVRRGTTVIYPIYQEPPFTSTVTPLPDTLAALRLAFAEVPVKPGRLVVAGHSAGGALAADYAASARAAGMPEPAAVFSVYPGRSLAGVSVRLEPVDAGRIAPGTRVLVLAGAHDRLVGTRTAREIVRTATRADTTLRIVRDPQVDDHAAPHRTEPAARRTFWEPLDRLVDATG